jgi:hypothetical protein
MAVFSRLTKEQIRQDYDHYGLMFGAIPVYIGGAETEAPRVCVRNWWPEWLLDVGEVIFGACVWLKSAIDPTYEPMYPIAITGKIPA